jgi:UDP-3-O-acyl-N-acetylglucosamine deacetylase
VSEGWTSNTICNNSVTVEHIAIAIDVMGRTNVIIQVEVRIAPISQHGVHNTTEEFKSNINL